MLNSILIFCFFLFSGVGGVKSSHKQLLACISMQFNWKLWRCCNCEMFLYVAHESKPGVLLVNAELKVKLFNIVLFIILNYDSISQHFCWVFFVFSKNSKKKKLISFSKTRVFKRKIGMLKMFLLYSMLF